MGNHNGRRRACAAAGQADKRSHRVPEARVGGFWSEHSISGRVSSDPGDRDRPTNKRAAPGSGFDERQRMCGRQVGTMTMSEVFVVM